MNIFHSIWHDIRSGKNLDIYATVVVIFVVVILDIFGVVDQSIISSATLAVLALVSTSLLSSRRDSEVIQNQISTLTSGTKSAKKFLEQEYSMTELHSLVSNSREVLLLGPIFTTAIPLLMPSIDEALKKGAEIKFLLAKPFGNAIKMFTLSGHYGDESSESEASLNHILLGNLRLIDNIAKKPHSGKLDVKVIDYLSPVIIYAFDSHYPNGTMVVRPIPPFRGLTKKKPSFVLNRPDDVEWHDYFVKQFEMLWEAGEFADLNGFQSKKDGLKS